MGALAKLEQPTPPFVTAGASAVTRDNLLERLAAGLASSCARSGQKALKPADQAVCQIGWQPSLTQDRRVDVSNAIGPAASKKG